MNCVKKRLGLLSVMTMMGLACLAPAECFGSRDSIQSTGNSADTDSRSTGSHTDDYRK